MARNQVKPRARRGREVFVRGGDDVVIEAGKSGRGSKAAPGPVEEAAPAVQQD